MNSAKKIIILIGDIAVLYGALAITLVLRYGQTGATDVWGSHILPFGIVFLIWLVVFFIDSLYDLKTLRSRAELLLRLARDLAIGGVLAAVFFYFAVDRLFTIRPQRVLLIILGTSFVLLYIWRIIASLAYRSSRLAEKIVIIGLNETAVELINTLSSKAELGYKVSGVFIENSNLSNKLPANIKINHDLSNLRSFCQANKIDAVISTTHPRQDKKIMKHLFECLPLKLDFYELPHFYEKVSGLVPVEELEQVWFLENLNPKARKRFGIVKNILDWLMGLILFTGSLPLWPIIAMAVKIDSPGPILFKQNRSGKNGKIIKAIKFRSMRTDAEADGPQWATRNDPRVTRVGKFIRKTRLDEIPQLFNVLRGEMAVIGPRPERPEFIEQLEKQIPFYRERLLVKPGLTGWAQINLPYGESVEHAMQKLQYDLYYIKNQSLVLDISIILKTIKTVLSGVGQ